MATTNKRIDISNAVDALTEIFGSREGVMETIALVLLDDGDISANEYENILHEIAMHARRQRYLELEQLGLK